MPNTLTESQVESACLEMLEELGYKILHGPDISEGGINEERKYNEVVLTQRLRDALERINKNIPKEAIEEAVKIIKRTDSQNQIINNQLFHKFITDGVPVEYKTKDGIKTFLEANIQAIEEDREEKINLSIKIKLTKNTLNRCFIVEHKGKEYYVG